MELTLIPNNTPENVLNTKLIPGEITFDVDLIKNTIQGYLSKYEGLVVQESDIKNIKSEVAFLRKQKTLINKNRIEFSKKFDEPLIEYKNDCDSVMEVIENTITYLNDQLNNFEEKRKSEKKELVLAEMNKMKIKRHMPEDFEFDFQDKFLNATVTMKNIIEELNEQCNQYYETKKTLEEIEKAIFDKKIKLEEFIQEINQNNQLLKKVKYVEYEGLLKDYSIEEIKEIIKKDIEKQNLNIEEKENKIIEKEKNVSVNLFIKGTESKINDIIKYAKSLGVSVEIKKEKINEIDTDIEIQA